MPSKRKNSRSAPAKKALPRRVKTKAALTSVPAHNVVEDHASPRWMMALMALSLVLWLISLVGKNIWCEKIFLVSFFLIGVSFFLRLTNPKHVLGLVGIGWALVTVALGNNSHFSFAYALIPNFHVPNVITQMALGFGLLAAFWRFLPPADSTQDISKTWARVWFWSIFALACFFRMYKVHEAVGCYWDDTAVGIIDPRGILEFGERPMLMPIGNREPFYSYFLAGLWALMPDAYAIFVHRLGAGLVDLVGVWLFYLLGKEVGGRRVGLVTMALGAVSKPMTIGCIMGATQVTVPMAVALMMLMTFRLFKNPSWKHFLYWGLALGFAPYNYTSVRPWLLFIVTTVFVWIWFHAQKDSKPKGDAALGWGTLVVWAFIFLSIHHFLPKGNPLVDFLSRRWVGAVLVGVLISLFVMALQASRAAGKTALVPRFFLGVLLAGSIIYPLATNPLLGTHPAGLSIFHDRDHLTLKMGLDTVKVFSDKVMETLRALFASGEDRGDMNLVDDAFYDYHFIPVFILGLMTLLIQPNWTKGFLLLCALVGISPRILSIELHSGMLIGGVAPMAVLAGLGVQQVYLAFRAVFPSRIFGFLGGLALGAYLLWASEGTFEKVYNQYFEGDRVEKTVSRQVIEYSSKARVFLKGFPLFISAVTQTLFNQGYDFFTFKDQNPICVKEGENPKDVVVILALGDTAAKALIESQFPKNVSWEVINLHGWKDNRPVCWRAIIPAAEIPDKPGKLFYFQRVPATNWTRDYLVGRNILGFGEIEMEESVASPYEVVPPAMGGRMVNVKGAFNLPTGGSVTFKTRTNDFVNFRVDGHPLIYLTPGWTPLIQSKTIELSAGPHQVDYRIWLQHEQAVPTITMSVGGGFETPLK